jgi:Flp pilus assembly protein TadB
MSGTSATRHRRARLKPVVWFVLVLAVLVVIGFAIGSKVLWIAPLVVLLLVLIGAFGIPRNVHDLNVPPGFTNAPGDITEHERDRRD